MAMSRRFGGTSSSERPSRTIWPSVGLSKPAMRRSVVVLPQPEGPSSVTNSPWAMASETSSTAVTTRSRARAGKVLVRCSRVRYMDAFTALASQGQPYAFAIVLGATIARLDQFHSLIAVLSRNRRWCTREDGVDETCVLLTIAPLVRDAQLPEVVLHAGLP